MPKYGFGVIADTSTGGQQSQMSAVLDAIAALIELADVGTPFERWVLTGVLVDSTDKFGDPIQVPVEVGCAAIFRSQVPLVRRNPIITKLVGEGGVLPMATWVESGDAANDAIAERHLKVELLSQGCDHWWGPLDRTSTIPAPPVPLSNFAPLTPDDL